jgi:hypothetical protein
MTTASEEKAGQEAVSVEAVPEPLRRQARTHASSVTPDCSLSPEAVTPRVLAVRVMLARVTAFLDRPGSLAHAHPPTFARAREFHHERATRHNLWAPLRVTRLVYGYLHLIVIKPALNFAEWVTETPLRLFGAIVLAVIVWHWS